MRLVLTYLPNTSNKSTSRFQSTILVFSGCKTGIQDFQVRERKGIMGNAHLPTLGVTSFFFNLHFDKEIKENQVWKFL